jgi:signal transduction histidine kinase
MDGEITAWSPGMEQRYGFTSSEALGRTSHQLLGTVFPRALREIEATLACGNTWSGVLIHRHADGKSVVTVSRWDVQPAPGSRSRFVMEVHANIEHDGKEVFCQLSDIIAILVHELSEPLTAIGNYVAGTQRILDPGWPDRENARNAMLQASNQIARQAEGIRLLRDLAGALRDAD